MSEAPVPIGNSTARPDRIGTAHLESTGADRNSAPHFGSTGADWKQHRPPGRPWIPWSAPVGLGRAPWGAMDSWSAPMGLDRAPWSGRFREPPPPEAPGAAEAGWTESHGAAVDFWSAPMGLDRAPWGGRGFLERAHGAGPRAMERPWIPWSAPMGLGGAPWSGRGFLECAHGAGLRAMGRPWILGARPWCWPARHGASVDSVERPRAPRPGASASRPATAGVTAGRQRHDGARADFPTLKTAAGWRHENTPRGRSPRGAVADVKRKSPGTRRLRGGGTMPQAARSISYASGGGAGGRSPACSGLGSRKLMEPRGPTTISVV